MPVSRIAVVLVIASCALLGAASPTTASSGGLKILVVGNCSERDSLATALGGQPGVASATAFNSTTGTPTSAKLAAEDLIVDTGDTCSGYLDAATYGDRLANYVDHGGAVLQVAYDNWNSPTAYPTGRFASGGYAPLLLGPNDNTATTLGQILKPNSPIVQGLGTFANDDNTTNAVAPGATLLAKWADGRNAIAVKRTVVATSASAYVCCTSMPDLMRLALNTGKFFSLPPDTKISRVTVNSGRHLASFRFGAIGYAASFKCELKKKGRTATFKPCTSPKRYTNLTPGTYTFMVAAIGRHGADPTPARKSFVLTS